MQSKDSPAKDLWHPYSLQQLTPRELASVVNAILQGHISLVSTVPEPPMEQPPPSDRKARREAAVRRHLQTAHLDRA